MANRSSVTARLWTRVGIPVLLALMVGSSSPWWWAELKNWLTPKENVNRSKEPATAGSIPGFKTDTREYVDSISGINLAQDGARGATFEVRYSYRRRSPIAMSIAVIVYSGGNPKSSTGPTIASDIRPLAEGAVGVVENEGVAIVNVKKTFAGPTQTRFIEVQLRDAGESVLTKQFPWERVWSP